MITPIPTPFDITEIPVIPWIPGTSAWITLLLATIACVLVAKLILYRRSKTTLDGVAERLLTEMQADFDSGRALSPARYARPARRILEHITKVPLTGLSAREICDLATGNSDALEQMALRRLIAIESISYEPPSLHKEKEQRDGVRELLVVLRQLLESSGAR